METSLSTEHLADMSVAGFRELFEAQFVSITTCELMRNQFRAFYKGGMGAYAFAKRFNEVALFSSKDVATDALK